MEKKCKWNFQSAHFGKFDQIRFEKQQTNRKTKTRSFQKSLKISNYRINQLKNVEK